jgi:hypothetical protein
MRRMTMPKTGSHLRIVQFGEKSMGVELEGNPNKPEPESFRVEFPGGIVDIERCEDGSYWVHTIINNPDHYKQFDPEGDRVPAHVAEARLHIVDKHTSEVDFGDFENPGLYDCAIHIVRS